MKNTVYLKAWFFFFLVATIGGAAAGAVVGAIIGAVLSGSNIPLPTITMVGATVGFLIGLPISYFTFRWSIQRFILPNLGADLESKDAERTESPLL
jgi:hypothetical protein